MVSEQFFNGGNAAFKAFNDARRQYHEDELRRAEVASELGSMPYREKALRSGLSLADQQYAAASGLLPQETENKRLALEGKNRSLVGALGRQDNVEATLDLDALTKKFSSEYENSIAKGKLDELPSRLNSMYANNEKERQLANLTLIGLAIADLDMGNIDSANRLVTNIGKSLNPATTDSKITNNPDGSYTISSNEGKMQLSPEQVKVARELAGTSKKLHNVPKGTTVIDGSGNVVFENNDTGGSSYGTYGKLPAEAALIEYGMKVLGMTTDEAKMFASQKKVPSKVEYVEGMVKIGKEQAEYKTRADEEEARKYYRDVYEGYFGKNASLDSNDGGEYTLLSDEEVDKAARELVRKRRNQ